MAILEKIRAIIDSLIAENRFFQVKKSLERFSKSNSLNDLEMQLLKEILIAIERFEANKKNLGTNTQAIKREFEIEAKLNNSLAQIAEVIVDLILCLRERRVDIASRGTYLTTELGRQTIRKRHDTLIKLKAAVVGLAETSQLYGVRKFFETTPKLEDFLMTNFVNYQSDVHSEFLLSKSEAARSETVLALKFLSSMGLVEENDRKLALTELGTKYVKHRITSYFTIIEKAKRLLSKFYVKVLLWTLSTLVAFFLGNIWNGLGINTKIENAVSNSIGDIKSNSVKSSK